MSKLILCVALLALLGEAQGAFTTKKVTWPSNKLMWTPPFDTYSDYIQVSNMPVDYYNDTMTTDVSEQSDAIHNIHYILTTYNGPDYKNSPQSIPVIFWFNGGPGCSGVGGMFTENGPFRISPDNMIYENIYAWNKLGHVVFFESPSDIGFSYTTFVNYNTNDNATQIVPHQILWNDTTSGQLNAMLIHNFFVANSDLANNPYWITGESYAGVYIPEMTYRIRNHIINGIDPGMPYTDTAQPSSPTFTNFSNTNLQGIAIGNGYLDDSDIINSLVLWQYYHGNLGKDRWEDLKTCCKKQGTNGDMDNCDYTQFVTILRAGDYIYKNKTDQCDITVWLAIEELLDHTTWDAYNIYQQCYNKPSGSSASKVMKPYREAIVERLTHLTMQAAASNQTLWSVGLKPNFNEDNYQSLYNYDSTDALYGVPCFGDNATSAFLNDMSIQKALNIPQIWMDTKWQWQDCDNFTYWSYNHNNPSQQDHIKSILTPFTPMGGSDPQYAKVMLYNGDVDSVCNFLSAQWFGYKLAKNNNFTPLPLQNGDYTDGAYYNPQYPRKKWTFRQDTLTNQNQLAGFYEVYTPANMNNTAQFFVVTVNGAGHFVPLDRAGATLQMLNNFMLNTDNVTKIDFSTPTTLTDGSAVEWPVQTTTPKGGSAQIASTGSLLSALLILAISFLIQ